MADTRARAAQDSFDSLLLWCSELGGSSWAEFRASCAELGLLPHAARIALEQLGHAEFDWTQSTFATAPPCLVGLPNLPGTFFLTGARPKDLPQHLHATIDQYEFEATVREPVPQRGIGPSSIYVEAEPAIAGALADTAGIGFTPSFAATVMPYLPSASLDAVGATVIPDDRFVRIPIDEGTWQPRWRDAGAHSADGLWLEQGFGSRPSWLIRRDGKWYRLPAGEWGPYVIGRAEPLVRYEPAHAVLIVDAAAPLPTLHARVCCLCSGRLPYRQHHAPGIAEDRYVNVDRELGSAIISVLKQEQA